LKVEKTNYYKEQLNSKQLFDVYDTNINRVKQYLRSEIAFIRERLKGDESILEIGAGYGRILKELAPYANDITGIDISENSVAYGNDYLKEIPNAKLEVMDAYNLSYREKFDIALCLQNGLSAIKGRQQELVDGVMKTIKTNGSAYFSTYSEKFWKYRLEWFVEQSEKGLIGEIDIENTKDGVICCKDGFKAITLNENDLKKFGKQSGYEYEIEEVDESSLFLVITKK